MNPVFKRWSIFSDQFCQVVDFLLRDSLTIGNVQTIKIYDAVDIVVFIYFIEDLPGCIELNLLHHFLELFVANFILSKLAFLVFSLDLLLQLLLNLIIFIHYDSIFLLEILAGQLSFKIVATSVSAPTRSDI